MQTVPAWKTPHRFRRLLPPGTGDEVVTYGLLSTLIAQADFETGDGVGALAERVGLAPLGGLAYPGRVSPQHGQPWAIARDAGRTAPGSTVDRILAADARAAIGAPADLDNLTLLEEFAENDAPAFRELTSQLRTIAAPIVKASGKNERPPSKMPGDVLTLLETHYANGLALEPLEYTLRTTPRPLWGFRFRNLAERIAVELFDLYTLRPRLRRCELCGRPFVPTRGERVCRLNLWRLPAGSRPSTEERKPVAFCVPKSVVDAHNARVSTSEHERTRRNLAQTVRRRDRDPRYGPDHELTKQARRKHRAYMDEHGLERGPPRTRKAEPELLPARQ